MAVLCPKTAWQDARNLQEHNSGECRDQPVTSSDGGSTGDVGDNQVRRGGQMKARISESRNKVEQDAKADSIDREQARIAQMRQHLPRRSEQAARPDKASLPRQCERGLRPENPSS